MLQGFVCYLITGVNFCMECRPLENSLHHRWNSTLVYCVHKTAPKTLVCCGGSRGGARSGPPRPPPPLRPEGPKKFFKTSLSPPYLRNWMTTPIPPPPLICRSGSATVLGAHLFTRIWVRTVIISPVQKATVNLLIRVKRNSKCICGNSLSLLGAQNEDLLVLFCRCYLPGLDCNFCHVDSY